MPDGMRFPLSRITGGARELLPGHRINQGLVGFWPLDEGGGPGRDLSPRRARADLVGTPSRVAGPIGRAPYWTNNNGYVDITSPSFLGGFSASIWVYLPSALNPITAGLVSSNLSGADTSLIFALNSWATQIRFWSNQTGAPVDVTYSVPRAVWMLLGVSYYADRTAVIFANGRPLGSGTTGAAMTSPVIGWSLGRYRMVNAWYHEGALAGARIWNRPLSNSDHASLFDDPWVGSEVIGARLFHPMRAPTAASRTGTLAATLDAAALASTATIAIAGTASSTLAAATLSATATVGIAGTATATLADTTVVATGTLPLVGTLSATLGNATAAATGTVALAGALAVTLDAATLAATGTAASVVTGTLAATLDAATLSAAATLALRASTTTTLADATLSATGTLQLRATASVTLAAASLSAAGTTGTVANKVVLVWNGIRI